MCLDDLAVSLSLGSLAAARWDDQDQDQDPDQDSDQVGCDDQSDATIERCDFSYGTHLSYSGWILSRLVLSHTSNKL